MAGGFAEHKIPEISVIHLLHRDIRQRETLHIFECEISNFFFILVGGRE